MTNRPNYMEGLTEHQRRLLKTRDDARLAHGQAVEALVHATMVADQAYEDLTAAERELAESIGLGTKTSTRLP